MISCDECQHKIVAVFDNEAGKGDEDLISDHIENCPDCQAFRAEIVKIRQALVSAAVPSVSLEFQHERLQRIGAAGVKDKETGFRERATYERLTFRFRRLAWVGGLAASFLIVVSWLSCFILARRIHDLQQELQIAKHDLAIANVEKQLAEAHERQEKTTLALYLRIQELEERFDRGRSGRPLFYPADRNGL
jgi:anti-sigma factor RsiW